MKMKALGFLLILAPSISLASVDMFLDIEGVTGDSLYEGREGEIDVLAWSWDTSFDGRCANIEDVSLTKWVDSSSPVLLMGQLMGREYERATFTVSRPMSGSITGGARDHFGPEYITIEFRNLYVSAISLDSSRDDDRLTETVSFNFESATYTYTPLDGSGRPGRPVTAELYPGRGCR